MHFKCAPIALVLKCNTNGLIINCFQLQLQAELIFVKKFVILNILIKQLLMNVMCKKKFDFNVICTFFFKFKQKIANLFMALSVINLVRVCASFVNIIYEHVNGIFNKNLQKMQRNNLVGSGRAQMKMSCNVLQHIFF